MTLLWRSRAKHGRTGKSRDFSSALQGTISGSSVANVVTSGSFTIPMMKKLGYKKEFAGAVEASASTGGQLMPPIMGAAAFLMVEFIGGGITYWDIAKAAMIPAVLYFTGIWIMTHFEAKRLGLRGLTKEEMPNRKEVFKRFICCFRSFRSSFVNVGHYSHACRIVFDRFGDPGRFVQQGNAYGP